MADGRHHRDSTGPGAGYGTGYGTGYGAGYGAGQVADYDADRVPRLSAGLEWPGRDDAGIDLSGSDADGIDEVGIDLGEPGDRPWRPPPPPPAFWPQGLDGPAAGSLAAAALGPPGPAPMHPSGPAHPQGLAAPEARPPTEPPEPEPAVRAVGRATILATVPPAAPAAPPRRPVGERTVALPGRPRRRRRVRPLWIVVGTVTALLGVLAGAAGAVPVAREWLHGGPLACTSLRVTVTPELAGAVRAAVDSLGCAAVTVKAEEPADTVGQPAAAYPDAWVPASSAWLRIAAAAASSPADAKFPTTGQALARSPLVVAIPRTYASTLGWPQRQPGWADLAAMVNDHRIPRFSVPDPQRSTVGLLTVLAVQAAMARTAGDDGIVQMRTLTLRSRLADAAADPGALLRLAGGTADPAAAVRDVGLFPVTEQRLWAYQRTGAGVPLVGAYPPDGLVEADYPLAVSRTADQARRRLADRIGAWFRTAPAARYLAANGFRTGPGVAAPPPAGTGAYPRPAPLPDDPLAVRTAAVRWAQYRTLAFQVLLLVDGSASMNDAARDRAGHPTTKADLLRSAGVQAAQLFGEDTSVAMWVFAAPPGTAAKAPYREVVPFGPITGAVHGTGRRDMLSTAVRDYRAVPGAGAPLYETVLRAEAQMRQRYRPDALTLVFVLSDGRDGDSQTGRAAFLNQLAAGADPRRPVPVYSIGYGADADLATLGEIARITGGQSVASDDPGDLASAMARLFLAAHQTP